MLEVRAPSQYPGMGAVVHGEWCSFRVWAPSAQDVALVGSFNGWQVGDIWLWRDGPGYWSADVREVVPGDQYKYVIGPGGHWRNDPYAREVTNSVGNSIVQSFDFPWGHQGFVMPRREELVIYELHPGTFNDAVGGGPGSFESVMARLPYLRDLGINAIELMPAVEFAADFSWGYNPACPFAIESVYGGPWRLKQLVRAAHEFGIAVIFDVVYNHIGPQDSVLWRFDGWGEGPHGGIYYYNDWRAWTEWGEESRPDYGRPEVREYLRENALTWLEEFRMDGLRWDATGFIHNVRGRKDDPGSNLDDGWRLMQEVNHEIGRRQPWKVSIAEDMWNNQQITAGIDRGGAGFDAQWDAAFVQAVRGVLVRPDDGARSMAALAEAIYHRYNDDAFRRVIYTESHDEVANGKERLPEAIWPGNADSLPSRKRSTLGAMLVFTAPGIPMLFQGQEILEDRWFYDQDPVDWTREHHFAGILELYRSLIRLRRNWFDHTRGLRGQHVNVHHVNEEAKILAFHRWESGGPRDDVVIMLNFADRVWNHYELGFPRPGLWRIRFNSDWNGYSSDFGNRTGHDVLAERPGLDGLPVRGAAGIGAYSGLILSQDG